MTKTVDVSWIVEEIKDYIHEQVDVDRGIRYLSDDQLQQVFNAVMDELDAMKEKLSRVEVNDA